MQCSGIDHRRSIVKKIIRKNDTVIKRNSFFNFFFGFFGIVLPQKLMKRWIALLTKRYHPHNELTVA